MRRFTVALALALATIGLGPLPPAHAASILVTTLADDEDVNGNCSLREATLAIEFTTQKDQCDASDPEADTIVLQAGTYTLTQPGAGENESAHGDLDLVSMTIVGQGVGETIIDGNGAATGDRVLHVLGGSSVTLRGLRVQHGATEPGTGIRVDVGASLHIDHGAVTANTGLWGAGIYNFGSLSITDSVISDNHTTSDHGGGVLNESGSTMTMVNSVISGNTTTENGGGIMHFGSQLSLTNVTVTGNSANSAGGGLSTSGASASLNNVTIAANTAGNSGGGMHRLSSVTPFTLDNTIVAGNDVTSSIGVDPDCHGTFTSGGHNLIGNTTGCTLTGDTTGNIVGQDPKLGPLADNGGPTRTRALLQGSPAIDAGGPDCAATDQRGVPRNCDMGAYELTRCGKVVVSRVGTDGNDVLSGSAAGDGFLAMGGNDSVRGLGGKDALCLGAGRDAANGGGGKDLLLGEEDNDRLRGAGGKDRLKGGPGRDRCSGGGGRDRAGCEVERSVP